jgi:hypothetical protein
MRRRTLLLAGLGVLALTAGTGEVAGARATVPTTLLEIGYEPGSLYLIFGDFVDTSAKCQRGREIRLLTDEGSGYEVRDVDRSSRRGAWAVEGDIDASDGSRVKTPRKRLDNGDICGADTLQLVF